MQSTIVTLLYLIFLFRHCESSTPIQNVVYNFTKQFLYQILDDSISETQCSTDLKRFIDDVPKLKTWALKMLDANNKLNPGILDGNLFFFGNFDQCLSVRSDESDRNTPIVGQYCTVPVIPKESLAEWAFQLATSLVEEANFGKFMQRKYFDLHFKTVVGLCIPKSCSVKNLHDLWSHLEKTFKIPLRASFIDDLCLYKGKQIRSSKVDVYVFAFFALIIITVIGCTVYECTSGRKGNVSVPFSLCTSMKKLLSTHCENDSLTCLYGIRVISMAWIILGHIATLKITSYTTNTAYFFTEWRNCLENAYFLAAPYAVDTFLSMSGILVIYVYLKMSEKRKINIVLFYIHRLVRLSPTLIVIILINISIIKYIGGGPMWPSILEVLTTRCEKFWWKSLFFISNMGGFRDQCIQQTWYLSVDTQLYALFPLILICLKKYPNKFGTTTVILCLLSTIYTIYKVIKNDLGFLVYWEVDSVESSLVYFSTLSRIPSWLIGIYFGYLLYQHTSRKTEVSKTTNVVLWTFSIGTMLALVLYHVELAREEHNMARSIFFNGFSRSLWSLAVCYVIFSCSTGHGGIINSFLSHPVFIVLGKLTYSMFFVHVLIIFFIIGNRRHSPYFSSFDIYFEFCGIFTLTVLFSTLLTLLIETPIFTLLKNLEKRKIKIN